MKGYNLYGLKVNSILPLPGFDPGKKYARPDTVVTLGQCRKPRTGLPMTLYKPYTIANKDFYYQVIPEVARYLVKGDQEVTIQMDQKATKPDAGLFFIETILPIVLMKNDIFLVKAAAVGRKDGVYLFGANRGDGISTLSAVLCLNGYRLVSEGYTAVKWNAKTQVFTTKCYYSHVHLWRNVFPLFKGRMKQFKIRPQRKDLLKFRFDFQKYKLKTYAPVKGLCFINVINDEVEPEFKPITGIGKMRVLNNIVLAQHMAKVLGKEREAFHFNTRIAKNLKVFSLSRSRLTTIVSFVKFVKDEVFTKTAE